MIYQAVRGDNPNYIRFRKLMSSENLKVAKEMKETLIKAYEAKVQVRRAEMNQEHIDVNEMLREIEDLHMGTMELAREVSMDKKTSDIDIEL